MVPHPMNNSIFPMLEGTVLQRAFGTSADHIFRNEDTPVLPRPFVVLVKMFRDEKVTGLKSAVLVFYPMPVVLHNFRKE